MVNYKTGVAFPQQNLDGINHFGSLCDIGANSLVLYAVIGMNAKIGDWSRVEGTPNDPNPNKPFAKTDNYPLFNQEGKLNPSITIVGKYMFTRVHSRF